MTGSVSPADGGTTDPELLELVVDDIRAVVQADPAGIHPHRSDHLAPLLAEYDRRGKRIAELESEVKLHESSGVLSAVLDGADRLRAQRAAVLRLHQPVFTDLDGGRRCGSCDVGPDDTYPCPTVEALGEKP